MQTLKFKEAKIGKDSYEKFNDEEENGRNK